MNDVLKTIIECMVIWLLLSASIFIFTLRNKIKFNRRILKKSARSLNDVNELIDGFIQHEFDNYRIMNLEHKNYEHINTELEQQIMNDVIQIVMARISTSILQTMSLYYAKDTIEDIIAENVYFQVTIYVYDINVTQYQTPQKIKNNMMGM